MIPPTADTPGGPPALDDFVAAFEAARAAGSDADLADFLPARAAGSDADLADFLPARDHPLYLAVLRELVRVDLELSWEGDAPRALADYRARFPELFVDRPTLAAVAFEEYRLRRAAGQNPSP